jgi:hypothetical protein
MQTRLFASIAGGLLGVVLAPSLKDTLGLTPMLAFIGLGVAGVAVGCAASLLFDVFSSSSATNR